MMMRKTRWTIVLLAFLMGASACGDNEEAQPAGVGQNEDAPGFEGEIPTETKGQAMIMSRQALDTALEQDSAAAIALSAPEGASFGRQDVRVFATLRVNGQDRGQGEGTATDFFQNVREAVAGAVDASAGTDAPLTLADKDNIVIELNAIFDSEALPERTQEDLAGRIEHGRHAVEFSKGGASAVLTGGATVTRGLSEEEMFQTLCQDAGMAEDCFTDAAMTITRHRTEHWIEDKTDPAGFFELYRGHQLLRPEDLKPELVEKATADALDYFTRHQLEDGSFDYIYTIHDGALLGGQSTIRQAGGTYSLCKGAAHFQTPERIATCKKALDLFASKEVTNEAGDAYLNWEGTRLGLTALATLAMAEFTVDEDYKELASRLTDSMVKLIGPDGRMEVDFTGKPGSENSQQFFPGEALLAIVRMTARYDNPTWREGLERAFEYYVPFWREQGSSAFVPWQSLTWAEMYFVTGERKYADFAFELIDWSQARQNRTSYGTWARDDYGGALTQTLSVAPNFSTATHCEPVARVIEAARDLGEDAKAERYLDRLRHALRFSLQLIVQEKDLFYLEDPTPALGSVRYRLGDDEVRIDGVQHFVTAMFHILLHVGDEPSLWSQE